MDTASITVRRQQHLVRSLKKKKKKKKNASTESQRAKDGRRTDMEQVIYQNSCALKIQKPAVEAQRCTFSVRKPVCLCHMLKPFVFI